MEPLPSIVHSPSERSKNLSDSRVREAISSHGLALYCHLTEDEKRMFVQTVRIVSYHSDFVILKENVLFMIFFSVLYSTLCEKPLGPSLFNPHTLQWISICMKWKTRPINTCIKLPFKTHSLRLYIMQRTIMHGQHLCRFRHSVRMFSFYNMKHVQLWETQCHANGYTQDQMLPGGGGCTQYLIMYNVP